MDAPSIILGMLMESPMTGYQLKQKFAMSFSFFSGLSYGSIYPALKKMAENGLITLTVEHRDGTPDRKVYTITDAGREAFLHSLTGPMMLDRNRSNFLTRLFFYSHLPPQDRLSSTEDYLSLLQEELLVLESSREDVRKHADHFQWMCFEFGVRFFNDLIAHVSALVETLRQDVERKQP